MAMSSDDVPPAAAGVGRLDAAELAELAQYGDEQPLQAGEVLFRAGGTAYDLYVVIEGEVEIVRPDRDGEDRIVVLGQGAPVGELGLITGARPYLTARVTRPGRALRIKREDLHRLTAGSPDIWDRLFETMAARRTRLVEGKGALAIRLVGSRYSPEALAIRAFLTRTNMPHTWIDVDADLDGDVLLASFGLRQEDVPSVLTAAGVLRRCTPGEVAAHLGLAYEPIPGLLFDLVVVGTGPAGLAAAVYGASEGLETVSIDSIAIGGQAGASSRIENYVGFPTGVSGGELASRAAMQALRLGARLNAPCAAAGLRVEHGYHVVTLADGSEIPARAVLIATGAQYRRLPLPDLDRFEGAGVYYAATELEARMCLGRNAVVVGGGNSAGQAALHLAKGSAEVAIAIRGADLHRSMSHYLVERIAAHRKIEILTETEVRALGGDGHLEEVTLEHNPTRRRTTQPCGGLFCFIGADPATGWLDGSVLLDDHGFILTDRDLPESTSETRGFAGRQPLPYETSAPGVFAVGDVRHGSLKRVASAVGEGSSAVRSVHDHLATAGG